jgi:type I restriction enzyme R subunit
VENSNFQFLESEFPILFNIGQGAEFNLYQDPIVCFFKLRQFGEKITEKIFEEHYLEFPRENSFHNRLKTLEYEQILPNLIKDLLFGIKNKGNNAVHNHVGTTEEARIVLRSTYKVARWFYQTYSEEQNDIANLKFIAPTDQDTRHAYNELEKSFKDLEKKFNDILEKRELRPQTEVEKQEIVLKSEKAASNIDLDEDDTRVIIDQQLRNAGWIVNSVELNNWTKKTQPEKGKNIAIAEWVLPNGKRIDYALFVGLELYGVIEAKKWKSDISQDLGQSKRYSEWIDESSCSLLGEWKGYKVPFLFSTNGRPYLEQIKTKSGIWFLDTRGDRNRSKPLRGWYSPEGLKELFEIDRAESDKKLLESEKDYLQATTGLGLRDYQIKAIEAVESEIIQNPDVKRALVAMATGTGKTRTIVGLCYRLIKANRFKRILFLVDRRLLAVQSFNAFKDNKIEDNLKFNDTNKVEGLKDIIPDMETRLHFATVQSMVKRLFYSDDEYKIPIDTYDCIIVDEAHRGYLKDREMDDEELGFKNQMDYVSKYRMVIDYFDAFTVGLTATPALHTTEIFGKPVFNYSYREAVIDGYLIDHEPPYLIKTKLSEEGITWKKGEKPKYYDKEDNLIKELDELEDDLHIEVDGFNKSVLNPSFNETVVKALVKELDPEGEDKTLIFAATDEHADNVVQKLKDEYENIGIEVPDNAIVKITGKSYHPQELVTQYKNEKFPNIAVTVDLLTTGIDVPPISNLVFLRRVSSRILYEQMLGRATRRCDEINKEVFRIYDAVGVYDALEDFTKMKAISPNPSTTFNQLIDELAHIDSEDRVKKQLDQLVAKLQRKKRYVIGNAEDQFNYNSKGKDPESFIEYLKSIEPIEAEKSLNDFGGLWTFLDELKPPPTAQYFSEHADEYLSTERGYGKADKPEDYLNSFKKFIEQNLNEVSAIRIICNRPKELDRKSLKELKLLLDMEGFNARTLNTAWKAAKNEDIAADIISYIRTLAIGSSLISHEDRMSNAVSKVKSMQDWNKTQLKWLERFEKQLIQETVLKKENLNEDPFDEAGGYDRLNKIFEDQLDEVLEVINNEIYTETA